MARNKDTDHLDFQISTNNASNQNKKRLREERTITHFGQKCSTSGSEMLNISSISSPPIQDLQMVWGEGYNCRWNLLEPRSL